MKKLKLKLAIKVADFGIWFLQAGMKEGYSKDTEDWKNLQELYIKRDRLIYKLESIQ